MKGLAIPVLLIICAVALFFTFTNAQYKEMKELEEDRMVYEERFSLIEALIKQRDEVLLPKFNNVNADQRQKLEKLLPKQVNNIRLINDIQVMLQGLGTTLDGFKFEDLSKEKNAQNADVQAMAVSITFNAPYETLIAVLKELERSLRIIDVQSITFNAGTEETHSYTVRFITYWLK